MRISLTRRYKFAAAHRLHAPSLSEAENQRIYGKCNNPYGHGHNYEVLVTLTGPVDPATGMIANLGELDRFVETQVLEAFDHRNLNEEIPAFRDVVPTTENLCAEVFRRLAGFRPATLERVRIEETSKNSFEITAEPGASARA